MKEQSGLSLEGSLSRITGLVNIKPEVKNGSVELKSFFEELTRTGLVDKNQFNILESNKERTSL
jgi:hypothetical protein